MGTIKKSIEEAEGLCSIGWAEADALDTSGAKESFKMIEKELATIRFALTTMESEWRAEAAKAVKAAAECKRTGDSGLYWEERIADAFEECADRIGICKPND